MNASHWLSSNVGTLRLQKTAVVCWHHHEEDQTALGLVFFGKNKIVNWWETRAWESHLVVSNGSPYTFSVQVSCSFKDTHCWAGQTCVRFLSFAFVDNVLVRETHKIIPPNINRQSQKSDKNTSRNQLYFFISKTEVYVNSMNLVVLREAPIWYSAYCNTLHYKSDCSYKNQVHLAQQ